MTIEGRAQAAGVALAWRPFLLGPIFAGQGWRDSPFNLHPAKGDYMWRDLERICAREALPWRRPSQFPRNSLLAARLALVGLEAGWGIAFSKAVFRVNFAEDRDIALPEVLRAIMSALAIEAEPAFARAAAPEMKEALRARNSAAQGLGIFGAPTFAVGGEIFWGHDRLAHALEWAQAAGAGQAR